MIRITAEKLKKGEKGQAMLEFALVVVIFMFMLFFTIDAAYIVLHKCMFKYAVSEGEWTLAVNVSTQEDTATGGRKDYMSKKGQSWVEQQIRSAITENAVLVDTSREAMTITDMTLVSEAYQRAYDYIFLDEGATEATDAKNTAPQAQVTVESTHAAETTGGYGGRPGRPSSTTTTTYDARYINDNQSNGKWKASGTNSWVQFAYETPQQVRELYIYWIDTSVSTSSYTVAGSDNGTTWTTINGSKRRSSSGASEGMVGTCDVVTFNENQHYRYYRITMTASSNSQPGVYEIKLFDNIATDINVDTTNYNWRVLTAGADVEYTIQVLTPFGRMLFGDTYVCKERLYVERLVGGTSQ